MIKKLQLLFLSILFFLSQVHAETPSSNKIFLETRHEINRVLTDKNRYQTIDEQIGKVISTYLDRPYQFPSIGEGDWQPQALTYRGGAKHKHSLPVYRSDSFDCQSLMLFLIALLMSDDLQQFDINYLKLNYKKAYDNDNGIVQFENRNHIVETDFNLENRKNRILEDVTPLLSKEVAFLDLTVDKKLFLKKFNIHSKMKKIRTRLSYLPIESFFIKHNAQFNEQLLSKISTPVLAEIVSDHEKWFIHGKNSQEVFGSALAISHMGLLYRKKFHQGEVIYQKISCHRGQCQVTPKVCEKTKCDELMFVHATSAYPAHYFWFKAKNRYFCSSKLLPSAQYVGSCNRVEQLPFRNYLLNRIEQAKRYGYEDHLIGIHFEKILIRKKNPRIT